MNILSLHLGHDGSVTILEEDEIIIHHQLDRFNKFKHEFIPSFELFEKIKNLKINFDRVLLTSIRPITFDIRYFLTKFLNIKEDKIIELNNNNHHIFHAECARHFFNYPKESMYFIADGDGALQTFQHENKFLNGSLITENESIYDSELKPLHKVYGTNNQININTNNLTVYQNVSHGKAYQKLTYELGLGAFEEGKAMALSSYGEFKENIANSLVFNQKWNLNLMNRFNESLNENNKFNRYMLDSNLDHTAKDSKSFDFVKTFQIIFQHLILNQIKKINFNYKTLILSGGCAQNILNNTFLKDSLDKEVLADPYNGDFGLSLGSALHFTDKKVKPLKHICSGFKPDLNLDKFYYLETSPKEVAELLVKEPIAIFHGKSEQGQRGLGFRSLLANPLQKDILDKINKIKKREWYRPFACTVIKEKAHKFFEIKENESSPYMMFAYKCKNEKLKNVCSIDNFSRIQTLEKSFHPKYYNLIEEFEKITSIPLVLNTSLNLPGKVLCEDLNDLYFMMKNSSLKYCYLSEENKLLWLK